ncbi:EpsG family protein [Methylocystis bryophila]|nr:EpsG family protein [Methylocystis bryophila]
MMIGFRWQVGGDWTWDTRRILALEGGSLSQFMSSVDPGYGALMWLTSISGFNIWFLHLIGGSIFAYGLGAFCLREPHPWLAMTVAVPYLIIVVSMGYDRQAVAIGFVMLAMIGMRELNLRRFVISMVLATSMHVTSLSLMPVFAIGSKIKKLWLIVIGGPIFAVGYYYLLQQKADTSVSGYIQTGYSSSGAGIRIAMNAIPAIIFLLFRKRFVMSEGDKVFGIGLSLLAMAFVVALIASPSSTAVDRMALYVIPLQMFVLGRLPGAFGKGSYQGLVLGVIIYSFVIMLVWLIFAENANSWVPYSVFSPDRLFGLSM